MNTSVRMYFEIPDTGECDTMFQYLLAHPTAVWDYEERVKANFHARGFDTPYTAHWTALDVVDTHVLRLTVNADSNIIEYETILAPGARDPSVLVDLLRRCKNVPEGAVGCDWTIHAWYRSQPQGLWIPDAGNGAQTTRYAQKMHTLVCEMQALVTHALLRAKAVQTRY